MDEKEFWIQVFLSVSGHFVRNNTWLRGEQKMDYLEDKAALAAEYADHAVSEAKERDCLQSNAKLTSPPDDVDECGENDE